MAKWPVTQGLTAGRAPAAAGFYEKPCIQSVTNKNNANNITQQTCRMAAPSHRHISRGVEFKPTVFHCRQTKTQSALTKQPSICSTLCI